MSRSGLLFVLSSHIEARLRRSKDLIGIILHLGSLGIMVLKEERWLNHNVGMFCGMGYAKKRHSVQNSVQYIKSNVMSNVYKFTYGNSSSIHPKKAGNQKIIRIGSHGEKSWDAAGCQFLCPGWPLKLKFEKKSLVSGVLMGKCRRSPMTGEITMPAPENFLEVLQKFVCSRHFRVFCKLWTEEFEELSISIVRSYKLIWRSYKIINLDIIDISQWCTYISTYIYI